jgi:hypothetical protein
MLQHRIGGIVRGKRSITVDTYLRLCRFFGLSDGRWLRLQADYDTEMAKDALLKPRWQASDLPLTFFICTLKVVQPYRFVNRAGVGGKCPLVWLNWC